MRERAHPDLNQGPADLQSAALTTGLCTHELWYKAGRIHVYGPEASCYLRTKPNRLLVYYLNHLVTLSLA